MWLNCPTKVFVLAFRLKIRGFCLEVVVVIFSMATPPHPDDPMHSLEVSMMSWIAAARWNREEQMAYFRSTRVLTPVVRQLKLCEDLKLIAKGKLRPPTPLAGYDYSVSLRGKDQPVVPTASDLYAQALAEQFAFEDKLKKDWIEYRKQNPGCKNYTEHTFKRSRQAAMAEDFVKTFEKEEKENKQSSSSSSSLGATPKAKAALVFGRAIFTPTIVLKKARK